MQVFENLKNTFKGNTEFFTIGLQITVISQNIYKKKNRNILKKYQLE